MHSMESFESSGGDNHAAQTLRILLIDDNEDSNEALQTLLALFNYDVKSAADGKSALETFKSFQPHLVLCDIGLPDITGYELAPLLREASGSRKVVIASLSGWGEGADPAQAGRANFDYQLTKPVDVDYLLKFASEQAGVLTA